MSKQFIDPNTGMPREDRRGTTTSLENKIAHSIGKLTADMKNISNRQEDIVEAVKNSFADMKESIKHNREHTNKVHDIVNQDLADLKEVLLSYIKQHEELNERDHIQLDTFLQNFRKDIHERFDLNDKNLRNHEKRIREIEDKPYEKFRKNMSMIKDIALKILVPVLIAAVMLLLGLSI